MSWEEILSDYNNAKAALWCPEGNGNWHREEEIGHYYMWNAYHMACKTEPKDYLLFARILVMMADEHRFSISGLSEEDLASAYDLGRNLN